MDGVRSQVGVAGWDLAGRCTGRTDCFSSRAEVSVTSWDASSGRTSHLFCSRPGWRMAFYQGFLRRLVSFPSTRGKKNNIKERETENSLHNAFFPLSLLSALLVTQPCENIWQLSKSRSLNIGLQLNIFPWIFFSFSLPSPKKIVLCTADILPSSNAEPKAATIPHLLTKANKRRG